MDRLVEMNANVEDLGDDPTDPNIPTVKFIEDGKKIRIEFAFKSEKWPTDPVDSNHPKRDSHRVLRERSPGALYANGLSVSVLGLSGQGALLQISMRVKSKIPGGGGVIG
jgi:hypothetical protein